MSNNRPLYWGQGQFLLPQHFQQQDLFHQHERQRCWRLGQPHGWGVEELHVREALPRNPSGKVLKRVLRDAFAA